MIRFRKCINTNPDDSKNNSKSFGVVFEPQLEDNGANSDAFKIGRSSYEKQGYKKRKFISINDYDSLLRTIILVMEACGKEDENNIEIYQAIAWVIHNRYYLKKHNSLSDSCEELVKNMQLVGSQTGCIDANRTIQKDEVENSVPYKIFDEINDPTFGAAYFKIQNYKGHQLVMPENYKMTHKLGNFEFYKESPQSRFKNVFNCNIS